jgi:hypothetical protein
MQRTYKSFEQNNEKAKAKLAAPTDQMVQNEHSPIAQCPSLHFRVPFGEKPEPSRLCPAFLFSVFSQVFNHVFSVML